MIMRLRVYIETTVLSYLTARPSLDLVLATRQAATAQWWREHRPTCNVFISALVEAEAVAGDAEASRRRMEMIEDIPRLPATPATEALARQLIRVHALPPRAEDDAAHVAIAAVHGMDVLLTWNCRHIANVLAAPRIRDTIELAGHVAPAIVTPLSLLESLGELP